MGWGSATHEALKWAKDTFEKAVRLEVRLDAVSDTLVKFESRIEARLDNREREIREHVRELELRVRALEQLTGSLLARVDGAYAEAIKLALLQPATKRRLAEELEYRAVADSDVSALDVDGSKSRTG
jgi:hypothetical protein